MKERPRQTITLDAKGRPITFTRMFAGVKIITYYPEIYDLTGACGIIMPNGDMPGAIRLNGRTFAGKITVQDLDNDTYLITNRAGPTLPAYAKIDKNTYQGKVIIVEGQTVIVDGKIESPLTTAPTLFSSTPAASSTRKPSDNEAKIIEEYKCPLTEELMERPVICTLDKKSYERQAIASYLEKHGESPTGVKMSPHQSIEDVLAPNKDLVHRIFSYKMHCQVMADLANGKRRPWG